MKKLWLVAKTTYRQRIRSGSFLLLTFGFPLLMVMVGAIAVLTQLGGEVPEVGYVDQTGQLADVEQVTFDEEVLNLRVYDETDAAESAFQHGEIGGYLLIPADYFEGQPAAFYGQESPNAKLEEGLTVFMRQAMAPDTSERLLQRLEDPSEITYRALASGEQISDGPAVIIRVATPVFVAMVFLLAVFTGASQLGTTVVQEKDQRAMEMVITSLAPRQLVSGKVLGMALLTLTQVGVWVAGVGITVVLLLVRSQALATVKIPWQALLWGLLLGVPGYFLYAVVAAGLGVLAGDKQQARQMAGMLGFLGMGPMYFMGALVNAMDSPLAVALTLFPLTAPTISFFRMALTEVPIWQLGASFAILLVSLAVAVWFLTRIFRAAMLMYGQALKPRQILRALRE